MAGIEIDGVSNKIELNTGAAAADQHILFNGNAQDFYIALDDSADDLLIGLGSTVGTTPIMLADENRTVTFQSSGIVDNFVIQSTNAGAETAPDLILDRSSASPADNDTAGKVVFRGRNDADESVEYAQITCAMTDVSNGAEDGKLEFDLMTGASSVSYMQFQDAGIVINEGSADIDFRIESNTLDDAFMVNAGTDSVLIGCQAPPSSSVGGVGFTKSTNSRMEGRLATTSTSSNGLLHFANPNGDVGGIATSGSSTAFNTSSDYRLKENVTYDFDATSRLKQLKPSRFNWISKPDITLDGFLAHEVSSIVPEAINGTKDATKTVTNAVISKRNALLTDGVTEAEWEQGKIDGIYPSDSTWSASKAIPKYQSIDQSKLVPLLVKTVQELEARIKALEEA